MKSKTAKDGNWRIGNLAKATGTSTDTLRHYERKGVLTSKRLHNGYRVYPEDAVERVRTVRKALAVGFDVHLTKPITEEDLHDALGKASSLRQRGVS